MRTLQIAAVAALLTLSIAPAAMAEDSYECRHTGNGAIWCFWPGQGGKGAPLPIVGAGLPLLAGAGLVYAVRKRLRR